MPNELNKNLTSNITKLVNQPYKYGFSTNIEKDTLEKGLSENIIRLISKKKKNLYSY
jgi:Fe-S cluster assembly protein SufB